MSKDYFCTVLIKLVPWLKVLKVGSDIFHTCTFSKCDLHGSHWNSWLQTEKTFIKHREDAGIEYKLNKHYINISQVTKIGIQPIPYSTFHKRFSYLIILINLVSYIL